MGISRTLQGINPSYSPLPLASAYAGVLGGAAVAAALFARERTGRGDAIEVPIASALLDALCFNTLDVEVSRRRWDDRGSQMKNRIESRNICVVHDVSRVSTVTDGASCVVIRGSRPSPRGVGHGVPGSRSTDAEDLPMRYFGRRQHKVDELRRDGRADELLTWEQCEARGSPSRCSKMAT